ncbi:hypothetical protein CHS0354_004181 [Potamilus streckersoni]|uniref:Uncharacterized protein n=1 Tax=Potamilus streckersoni TaxID=2493646 RepID=A0AAE0SZI7_9BIVA|nr:hypothetical protein CHS0354_004181 [Potamilus streckersoni]
MASSTQEDNRESEEESRNFGAENGDESFKLLSEEATVGRGRVSIFCRSCLNPYSGQEKGGSVILRCEKCGHRDVVREEEAADIDPTEYSGNLMLNRFMNVFQDKTITLNLNDPEFAGDGYEDLCGALEDYMAYLQRVFDKYQKIVIAARERHNERVMEEYKSNLQKRIVECLQDGSKKVGENAFQESKPCNLEEVETSVSEPKPVMFGLLKPEEFNLTPEENAKLREVRKDALEFVKEICERRKLPHQILVDVSTRINCPLPEDREDSIAAIVANFKEQERLRSEGRNVDEEEFEELERLVEEEEREVERRSKEKETETCVVNVNNGTKANEVDSAINNKGDMSYADVNLECEDKNIGKNESWNASVYENDTTNVSEELRGNPVRYTEQENNPGQMKKDNVESRNMVHNRKYEDKETIHSEKDQNQMTQEEKDRWEEFQFQAATNGFLKAVQRQKRLRLVRRRRRAMEKVHQQIETMKAEVFRVEHEVSRELREAYIAKMAKATNQRKVIEEKRQQVKDLRELIEFYTETGQNDKLRELLNSLDLPKEN